METKLFEIRDKATFIPMLAIRLFYRSPEERFLLRRAGYAQEQITEVLVDHEPYVILCQLNGDRATYDPYNWGGRTYPVAHRHIIERWATLKSGDVIDVEHILGERPSPKLSERFQGAV
jgi:hypothetical protein